MMMGSKHGVIVWCCAVRTWERHEWCNNFTRVCYSIFEIENTQLTFIHRKIPSECMRIYIHVDNRGRQHNRQQICHHDLSPSRLSSTSTHWTMRGSPKFVVCCIFIQHGGHDRIQSVTTTHIPGYARGILTTSSGNFNIHLGVGGFLGSAGMTISST